MELTLFIRHDRDGSLRAEVEELPGAFAAGDDMGELRQSLEGAISLWLTPEGGDPPRVALELCGPTADWSCCRARARFGA